MTSWREAGRSGRPIRVPALSTAMRPPFASTAHFAIARPRPGAAHLARSTLVDAIETIEDPLAVDSGEMPGPWSATDDDRGHVASLRDTNLDRRSVRGCI